MVTTNRVWAGKAIDGLRDLFARRPLRVWIAGLVLVTLAVTGGALWHSGQEQTKNAYVDGHLVMLAAQVEAVIDEILVTDNQKVRRGDLLLSLDDRAAVIRVRENRAQRDEAQAAARGAAARLDQLTGGQEARRTAALSEVRRARAELAAAQAAQERSRAPVREAEARARLAANGRDRAAILRAQDVISDAVFETAEAEADAAEATLAAARNDQRIADQKILAARERLATATAHLDLTRTFDAEVAAAVAALDVAEARAESAEAQFARAELELSWTELRAPIDGVVARRGAAVGQLVRVGTPLLGLVGDDELWVVAYFQQQQTGAMRAGQPARVRVDGLDRELDGTVQGLSMATGSKFSVLPPDYATGYFVKVPQWIPVRIDLPMSAATGLRPGMSARVSVRTRDHG